MRYIFALALTLAACGAPNAIPPSPCSPACFPGQACIAGRCFVEVDADAGPGDAAVGDTGTADAPADVAVGDAGIDAVPVDVLDADSDVGGDAATDAPATVDILPSGMCPEGYVNCIRNECSSLQRDPRVCGSCMYQCGAGADCVGGRCVTRATGVACDLGRGDCDGMAANGCETDTASDRMNCGGCGRACVSAREQCINGGCAPR